MKKSLFTLAFAFLLVSTAGMLFAQKNANLAKEIEMGSPRKVVELRINVL